MAIVFDLEGVLINNFKRLNFALKEIGVSNIEKIPKSKKMEFWKIFMDLGLAEKLDEINPKGIEVLIKKIKENYKIAIISGTSKRIVNYHLGKIKEHLKILKIEFNPVFISWRPKNDKRPASALKYEKIQFLEKVFRIKVVEVHDDDPKVIDALRKLADVRLVLWQNLKPISEYDC